MDTTFSDRLKEFRLNQGMTQERFASILGLKKQSYVNVESGNRGLSQELLTTLGSVGVDLTWLLTGKQFLNSQGHIINDEVYNVASHIPQRLSAGPGQEMLPFPEEDLLSRAPYPSKWGKGLFCAEVIGDSMTEANIFDGDLVYFKPGEIRGNGLYVLQLNGTVLVKRIEFDELEKKLYIISENKRYERKTESCDSQAVTILGKVKGWMHQHPY